MIREFLPISPTLTLSNLAPINTATRDKHCLVFGSLFVAAIVCLLNWLYPFTLLLGLFSAFSTLHSRRPLFITLKVLCSTADYHHSWTMPKVCVLGAGATGMTATKACLEQGFDVVVYERTNYTGGLWRYQEKLDENGTASVMKSTIINSSKEMSAFSDFPPPPGMRTLFCIQHI